ncbi:MAG: hypothetical protein ABI885_25405, partial [Gammaproteobacteria bacterium]
LRASLASGSGSDSWWYFLQFEPAYEALRKDARFGQLIAAARAHSEEERKHLARLRAEGLVPESK